MEGSYSQDLNIEREERCSIKEYTTEISTVDDELSVFIEARVVVKKAFSLDNTFHRLRIRQSPHIVVIEANSRIVQVYSIRRSTLTSTRIQQPCDVNACSREAFSLRSIE